jgi:hypothetical protein
MFDKLFATVAINFFKNCPLNACMEKYACFAEQLFDKRSNY